MMALENLRNLGKLKNKIDLNILNIVIINIRCLLQEHKSKIYISP